MAEVFLLLASLVFYAYNHVAYLAIIVASIVVNFWIVRFMGRTQSIAGKRALLILGILFNIGIIGYYKYWTFVLWNVNYLCHTDFVIRSIILPLGISFYTIQQLSFLVDAWKGENVDYGFIEYALYVSFFPQLVAGPIVYHSEFIPQLKDYSRRVVNYENLVRGIMWFILGLAKKVLLADRLGKAVEWGYADVSRMGMAEAWIIMFAYAFQLYFDFSGYSDMACGIGLMFNIRLPQNFNSPYKSVSVRDYWKRWHMTLTRFMTANIYFPLGGSRKGTARLIFNTMVVFLVSGIWHGANYTFILWGLINGALVLINKYTGFLVKKVPDVIKWAVNFLVINMWLVLFRASGVRQCIEFLRKLFSPDGRGLSEEFLGCFDAYLPFWLLLAASAVICFCFENNYNREIKVKASSVVACAALLVVCLFTLNRTSIFLYFNF